MSLTMSEEARAFREMSDADYREIQNGRQTIEAIYAAHEAREEATGDALALDTIADILRPYALSVDNSIMREIRAVCIAAGREAL